MMPTAERAGTPRLSGCVQERISKTPTLLLKTGKSKRKSKNRPKNGVFGIFALLGQNLPRFFFFPNPEGKKKPVKSLILEVGR